MKKIRRAERIKRTNQNNPRLTPKKIRKYIDDNYAGYNGRNHETHPEIYHCTDDEISEVIALFQETTKSILTREYIADYFQSSRGKLRLIRGRIYETSYTKLSNIEAHQKKRHKEKFIARIRKELGLSDDDHSHDNYVEHMYAEYMYDENDYDEDEYYDESEYDEE